MGSHLSYPLGPEVQFLVDQLDELRVAEGEEVDDLIDPSQKLVSPEVSLQSQVKGEVSVMVGRKVPGPSTFQVWFLCPKAPTGAGGQKKNSLSRWVGSHSL